MDSCIRIFPHLPRGGGGKRSFHALLFHYFGRKCALRPAGIFLFVESGVLGGAARGGVFQRDESFRRVWEDFRRRDCGRFEARTDWENRIMDWRTAEKIEHLGSRANACGMAKHAAQDLRRAALEWGSGDANIFRQNARHVRNFAREAEGGRGGGCQFDSHGARLVRLDLRTAFSRARADCAIVRTCIYVFAIDWYRDILAPKFLV